MNRFTSLPAEIVNEIAFLADKSTLLALCRVCKATNSPATRTLYRYLLLESPRQVVQCLKALLKNDYAAKSCRAFGIECQIDVTQALHLNNFFRLIAKALVRIRMVEAISLTISHWFPGAIRLVQAIDFILKDCTFPHLEHAHLQMAVTPTVASFLERHQKTLKSVVLCPRGVGPSSLEEPSIRYHFPRLANVRATASVALPFFKAISGTLPALTSLDINWDPFDMVDHKQLIDAVRKKDAPLDMVTFLRTGWNKELIEEMSLCFPHIRDLSICSYLAIGLNTTVPPDLIDDIAKNLKRFKSLAYFWWTIRLWGTLPQPTRPGLAIEHEYQTLTLFGDACPSLRFCKIPYGHSWMRCERTPKVWFPVHPSTDSGASYRTLFHFLNTRTYPAISVLLEYMEANTNKYPNISPVIEKWKETASLPLESNERRDATVKMMAIGHRLGIWRYFELDDYPMAGLKCCCLEPGRD